MYDVSKPTLYKDMSDGRLSFTKDERKRRKINVAELDRLYEKREGDEEDFTLDNVNNSTGFTDSNVNSNASSKDLILQIKAIREQIEQAKDREIELLEQQIEQLRDQNENLNRHLEETREEHRVYVRLLEDKREEKGDAAELWDYKLHALEKQISMLQDQNQILMTREEERIKRDEERRKRIEERKRQRELVKQKEGEPVKKSGFLERLFG